MATERLQKVLAAAGVASRREAERMIAAGRVSVDGKTAVLGQPVDPVTSAIQVDGRAIGEAASPVHLVIHKPAGVVSTVRDRHAERTVLDLVPTAMASGARLYPVGRLDQDSEGLILLTNDGAWSERVLHPRFGVEREYALGLRTELNDDQQARLRAGIRLEEGLATLTHLRLMTTVEVRKLEAVLAPPPPPLAWYRATLQQGWKRQLRRMFGAVGAPVDRLVRVRLGTLRLEDLASGRCRRLTAPEVRSLGAGRSWPREDDPTARPARSSDPRR
jgi:23S rRNA pseudouridine2605 synthase